MNLGIASYCALNHTLVSSYDIQFNECKPPTSERDALKQRIESLGRQRNRTIEKAQ